MTRDDKKTGVHFIELSVPSSISWVKTAPYSVRIDRESARTRASLHRKLRRDPRVAYLRANAQRVRTISPADTNYADLDWLREPLQNVRVVMFGEGDHGGGSDLLAQTRLIKFLHRRMGYHVVVFESGIHPSAAAWRALQSGANPTDAFLKGVFSVWGRAVQAKPLIDYLAANALGPQSFTIGFTSYNGATHWVTQPDDIDQDVIPAQRSLFEFESMMNAAGRQSAFVNLRTPPKNADWLRGRFAASAIYLMPQEADWGNVLDGLFFIRTQEPRRKEQMSKGERRGEA